MMIGAFSFSRVDECVGGPRSMREHDPRPCSGIQTKTCSVHIGEFPLPRLTTCLVSSMLRQSQGDGRPGAVGSGTVRGMGPNTTRNRTPRLEIAQRANRCHATPSSIVGGASTDSVCRSVWRRCNSLHSDRSYKPRLTDICQNCEESSLQNVSLYNQQS